jgi:hypothetical protein
MCESKYRAQSVSYVEIEHGTRMQLMVKWAKDRIIIQPFLMYY